MADYKEVNGGVWHYQTSTFIPVNHRRFKEYLAYVASGGTTDLESSEVDIETLKTDKRKEIYTAFNEAVKQPVQVGELFFDGGWTSIDKLFKANEFAKAMGISERTYYETDETPHTLPVEGDGVTGTVIMMKIGLDYDAKDTIMREKIKAVNTAETESELSTIDIAFNLVTQGA